jgi:putative serine protease PepD
MTNGEEEENAASAQPTEPAQATDSTEPPPPPPDDSAAPSGPPPTRGGWLVPKWAVAAMVGFVAVALIFGSAFAIGRATASGGDDHERIERGFGGRPPRGEFPQLPQRSGVFLGVSTQSATGGEQGAMVENVASGSPAAGAGLQQGDVITAVDGTAVTSPADLARLVRSHQPGDQVTIAYSRSGNSAETQVQLADRASENAPAS